jgi:hypothetical protein
MQQITFNMSDEEFEIYAACFCRHIPIQNVQVVIDGEIQFDDDDKPVMTDYTKLEWIKMSVVRDYLAPKGLKGFDKLRADNNQADKVIIKSMLENL